LDISKKLKADPEKTQATVLLESLRICQVKTIYFLIRPVWEKSSENIASNFYFFTKLNQIFKKLKEFRDECIKCINV